MSAALSVLRLKGRGVTTQCVMSLRALKPSDDAGAPRALPDPGRLAITCNINRPVIRLMAAARQRSFR
ncbi:MAG: hypothetical protein HKN63_01150 [Rhodobacteraceae bacterium]|nr:hypothetical protein [Paracoccaceae bacterium]